MKTTREKAKEDNHKNLVDNLQELLEKNYDAEKGFKKALEDSNHENLKGFLKHQAVKRSRFATEIDKIIRDLDEKPKEDGSATGTAHRAWIDVKNAFTGKDDDGILEECIRGDKASVDEYEEKMKNNDFPQNITSVLDKQLVEIQQTLSKVKTLENLNENWE
ncbi:PA2169 family four-helix-bundle protein [Mesonia sp. MT50]|uniref:PA2169 family four-helix-bundle protein n=1 Tax=Mesonia profundi TaxID=3070998 RepID=A0ABU1A461_9FLAO|nr:PA2169 family four-helix-bundle protein [Mesonia profundi]MDQ7918051.1 PA2169 family four-helix-bundle protein [Mesonia profundi]